GFADGRAELRSLVKRLFVDAGMREATQLLRRPLAVELDEPTTRTPLAEGQQHGDVGWYLYGFVSATAAAAFEPVDGVDRQPTEVMVDGPLRAIVSPIDLTTASWSNPERLDPAVLHAAILEHERVLDRMLLAGTVIPM